FILVIRGADLEELPFLPLLLARLKTGTVRPDYRTGGSAGVSKPTGVEGFVVARRSPDSFGEGGEEIDRLVAGNKIAQSEYPWFFASHDDALIVNAWECILLHLL